MSLDTTFLSRIVEEATANEYTSLGRLSRSGHDLGTVQRIHYNGVEFPVACNSSAEITPLYSKSGRRRTGTRIDITVNTIFVDQSLTAEERGTEVIPTTDIDMATLRGLLTTNGGVLIFELQGLGIMKVVGSSNNVTSSSDLLDLDNGPRTTELQWTPLTPLACKVQWKVSVTVNDCETIPAFRDISCTINTTVDHVGYTTRVIQGEIQVPSYNDPSGFNTADETEANDNLLQNFFPALDHFNRKFDKTLNEDGSTLNFTITDTEIRGDSPYFPGIAKQQADLRVQSSMEKDGGAFASWQCSLTGTFEVINGVSKLFGYLAALALIDYYLEKGFEGELPSKRPGYPSGKNSRALLTALSFRDAVYDKKISFSAKWTLMTSLNTLIQSTGLFKPVLLQPEDGGDISNYPRVTYNDGSTEPDMEAGGEPISFSRWRKSVNTIQNPHGIHGLVWDHENFPTVSICGESVTINNDDVETYQGTGIVTEPKVSSVDPEKSYVHGEMQVEGEEKTRTYYSSPMLDSEAVQEDVNEYEGTLHQHHTESKPFDPTLSSADGDSALADVPRQTMRRVGKSLYKITIKGLLIRAGYYPITPSIGSVGDNVVRKTGNDKIVTKVIGTGTINTGGIPVPLIATSFRKSYLVETSQETPTPKSIIPVDSSQGQLLDPTVIG